MKQFFITGTDTNIGKTLTSAILMQVLKAEYWKPIQTGTEEGSDRDWIEKITVFTADKFHPSAYEFAASLSPHQAAALENTQIDLEKINKPVTANPFIIEGAGGIYVPINQHASMLDVMQKCNLPVIVVARGTLGTINHTLLTINGLKQHGLTIKGVVFSGELYIPNQKTIEEWGQVKTLFHIPTFPVVDNKTLNNWLENNSKLIEEALA